MNNEEHTIDLYLDNKPQHESEEERYRKDIEAIKNAYPDGTFIYMVYEVDHH